MRSALINLTVQLNLNLLILLRIRALWVYTLSSGWCPVKNSRSESCVVDASRCEHVDHPLSLSQDKMTKGGINYVIDFNGTIDHQPLGGQAADELENNDS